MNDLYPLAVSLALGIGLGFVYFGGLWVTVSRIARVQRPALALIGSYLLRLAVMAICFTLLARGGHWDRLLVCLTGVVLVQVAMVRKFARRSPRKRHSSTVPISRE